MTTTITSQKTVETREGFRARLSTAPDTRPVVQVTITEYRAEGTVAAINTGELGGWVITLTDGDALPVVAAWDGIERPRPEIGANIAATWKSRSTSTRPSTLSTLVIL